MNDIFAFLPTATTFLTNGERPVRLSKAFEKKDKDIWEVDIVANLDYADVIKQDYILFMKSRYGYQPFRINNIEIGETLKSTAKHLGFDTKNYLVTLSTPINVNCLTAMQDVLAHTYPTCPFTVYSDITSLHTLTIENMSFYDAMTTLADAYNGYLDFDGFQVRIMANEGADRGVTVEYQKNLIGATVSENWDLVVTDLMPVSTSGLTIPAVWLHSTITYDKAYARRVEFNTDTVANLEWLAGLYLARYEVPRINYVVKSEVLQDVYRGDTIYCQARQFTIFMEVISFENDILRDVVTAVEFGNYRNTLKTFFGSLRADIQMATLQKAQIRIDEVKGIISLLAIDVTTATNTANTATANAATAKAKADTATTNAATAQTSANTAQETANTANGLLADLASDSKLTAVEKQLVKKEWDGIVSEKTLNDAQATTFGITIEKTNYGTSYNTLSTYITPLLANIMTTSDIVGTTFRASFKDYYDKLTTLLNAIAVKAKTLADTAATNAAIAQATADGAASSAAGLTTRVNAAELLITPTAITSTVEATTTKLANITYVDNKILEINAAKPNRVSNLPASYEQGTLTAGVPAVSNYHIRTRAFYPINTGYVTVKCNDLYEAMVVIYSSTYAFVSSQAWGSLVTFSLAASQLFKVVLRSKTGNLVVIGDIATSELKVANEATATMWNMYYGDLTLEAQKQLYLFRILSRNGLSFDGTTSKILDAQILLDNIDVTSVMASTQFAWTRVSLDPTLDAQFNALGSLGSSLTVTTTYQDRDASYKCVFAISDVAYLNTFTGNRILTLISSSYLLAIQSGV